MRGAVVWIEFGFNIGNEFGGRHPAIIMRKTGSIGNVKGEVLNEINNTLKKCHIF